MGQQTETTLAWAYEGEIFTGTVNRLASWVEHAKLAGESGPCDVYAARGGRLVPVPWAIKVSQWDEDDYATATVSVDVDASTTLEASYRKDGRA